MTVVSERDRIGGDELKKLELIRRAALKSFATRGAAATSLRSVAADAGVSLGLVQHHFATKAGLIKAVDDYVMSVVIEMVSRPVSAHPEDSIADMGSRITNSAHRAPRRRGLLRSCPHRRQPAWHHDFGHARRLRHGALEPRERKPAKRAQTSMSHGRPSTHSCWRWAPSSCAATSSGRSRMPSLRPHSSSGGRSPSTTLLREGLFPRGSDTGS